MRVARAIQNSKLLMCYVWRSVHYVIWQVVIRTLRWPRMLCVFTTVYLWLLNCWIHQVSGHSSRQSLDSYETYLCVRPITRHLENTAPYRVLFNFYWGRTRILHNGLVYFLSNCCWGRTWILHNGLVYFLSNCWWGQTWILHNELVYFFWVFIYW